MSQDGRTPDNRSHSTHPNLSQPHVGSSGGSVARALADSAHTDAGDSEAFSDSSAPKGVAVATAVPKQMSESEAQSVSGSVENPTLFAETSADDLMQDVFGDVDRMLQTGVSVAPESSKPTYVDLKPLPLSDLNSEAGGALAPRIEEDVADLDTPEQASTLDAATGDRTSSKESAAPAKLSTILLRVALVVSASVALGVGLAVWMAQRSQTRVATQTTTVEASSGIDSAQPDFVNYMTESLDAIDARYEQADRLSGMAPDSDGEDVSTASRDSSTPLPERVYIPVYQPPQVTAALPSLTASPFSTTAPVEEVVPTPTPAAPSSNASATDEPATQSNGSIPNISPDTSHALVGLLELGDRSAAIFEHSGTAHRIEVGAQIGSSGWSLVSVSAQEAIIRRNGDVRSVYIGQSF